MGTASIAVSMEYEHQSDSGDTWLMNFAKAIGERWVGIALVVLLTLTQLDAHDFWLASSPWIAQPGSKIVVTANVGDDTFPISESFTRPERIESVRVLGPEGGTITPRFRKIENSLAADIELPSVPTTYVVVMSVKGHFLSMAADKFEEYLKEEGLDAIVAERARRGETNKPSRERYWRQAKMLVHAGEGPVDHVFGPAGLVAELPDSDFTRARPGDTVGVVVPQMRSAGNVLQPEWAQRMPALAPAC
jgi:Domain of unknown function (DUF4198)